MLFSNLAGLINQINGKIDEILIAPENTITSRQLGKLLQVDKWNGQSTLVAMKQQFGSLRSYLEMQHIAYSLSFPEDIAPDFIIRLRIDDSEEISTGMYSDGRDIDDDDENDERDNDGNDEIVDDEEEEDGDNSDDDDDDVVNLKISPTTATKKLISNDVTGAVYEISLASTKENSNSLNSNKNNPEYALIDKMTLKDMKTLISYWGHSDDNIVNMKKEEMRNVLYLRADYESYYIHAIESEIREYIQRDISNETVSGLKEILRAMVQKVSGSKEVLRDRFVDTALCHKRYYHLIKKWRDLKFELDFERDFTKNPDGDLEDSSKKKNEKEILLATESLTEISRLENKINNKENKDNMIVITGQAKVDMIMNLLQAQLSSSSEDLTYCNGIMRDMKVEYRYYSLDSITQSQRRQQTETENENENENNEKLLEAFEHPANLYSRTDIFGSRKSLMNQLTSNFTSTSTSSTISPLRKRNDIIDDKKIIEVIVNFLKESDDLKVTH